MISSSKDKTEPTNTVYREGKRALPEDFQPSEHDFISGRGNALKRHPGNLRFLQLIEENLQEYAQMKSKNDKSLIVSRIVNQVRKSCPNGGGFVQQEGPAKAKRWVEIGNHLAREKVGARLRDALHSKYSSSSVAKKRRRRADDAQRMDQLDDILVLESSQTLAARIEELTQQVVAMNHQHDDNMNKSSTPDSSANNRADDELLRIFNQANWELLQKIKEQGICNTTNDESPSRRSSSSESDTSSSNGSHAERSRGGGTKRKLEFDIAELMESQDDEDDFPEDTSFEPFPFEYVFAAQ